ncbi:MAG: tagaturonate reductase [Ruminococcaceae bacterium]|nr:tagaturonate reductase [Oscillospiraceae bacterium]
MLQNKTIRTERFIQFGEGGFLRGFADWMIQKMNEKTDFEGSVVVVQPIPQGLCDKLEAQNCNYTHIIRGKEGVEKSVIDVISRTVNPYADYEGYLALAAIPTMRYVISNTTEAGIVFDDRCKATDTPPASFPAKVTQLLLRRFSLGLPGFVFLPCELIDRNGDKLREAVLQYADLWELGADFKAWVLAENEFCSTLVDRINTGYPKDETLELGYEDGMVNTSEYFHLWVIETQMELGRELPFAEAGLNVIITKNELEKYRTRKVRILNGAHTSMVPYALLCGFDTVLSCMEDKDMHAYIRRCVFEEIIPTLDLPRAELEDYAENVLTRFANPYIKHYLSSIVLNSVSKFKVRVLPSILEYKHRFGTYPKTLTFALGKLIAFYKHGAPNDVAEVTAYLQEHSVAEILANTTLWDADLTALLPEVLPYVD